MLGITKLKQFSSCLLMLFLLTAFTHQATGQIVKLKGSVDDGDIVPSDPDCLEPSATSVTFELENVSNYPIVITSIFVESVPAGLTNYNGSGIYQSLSPGETYTATIGLVDNWSQSLDGNYLELSIEVHLSLGYPISPYAQKTSSLVQSQMVINLTKEWLICKGNEDDIQYESRLAPSIETKVFPNPSKGELNINLAIEEEMETKVSIYNALGQELSVIYDGELDAGEHQWTSSDLEQADKGIYFVRIEYGNESLVERIVKL